MKIGNCGGSEHVELEKLKHGGKRAAFGAEFRDLLDQELAGAQASAGCCPLQSETAVGISRQLRHDVPFNPDLIG
ncbi:MAG: hypothetical protein HGB17_09840 [Syntrophobacteraceae bacterium]|nr:hypothetical protein [Syntrophobacteraceae bacterium]